MASSAAPDLDEDFPAPPRTPDPQAPAAPAAASDREPTRGGSRLLGVAGSLLQVHVEVAQKEFARDEGRILLGVVLMMIGALLVATVIVLLQVLGIALLQAHGLRFALAVLAMAVVDAGLGALLLYLGRRALRQPLMAETRAMVRRTLRVLMGS